jgi:hypothetical protein
MLRTMVVWFIMFMCWWLYVVVGIIPVQNPGTHLRHSAVKRIHFGDVTHERKLPKVSSFSLFSSFQYFKFVFSFQSPVCTYLCLVFVNVI